MQVNYSMLDKEIRQRAYFFSFFLKANRRSFNFFNRLTKGLSGKDINGIYNDEIWVNSRDKARTIRTRIHKPLKVREALPGVLYLHGGGYALNIPETEQHHINCLIEKRPCVVVAPDYRLSVDQPYPAALNDCYDILLWMKNNHKELGIRPDQLIVYGGSAGGGLAIAICLFARDHKDVNIAFQVPLYPMIDDTMSTASMKENNGPVWNEPLTAYAWSLYLKDRIDIPIYAAPYRAKDLSGLPPAFTYVGELDPFRDECIDFMTRLEESSIHSEFKVFKQVCHGFESLNHKAKVSKEANAYILDRFAYGVDHFFSQQIR